MLLLTATFVCSVLWNQSGLCFWACASYPDSPGDRWGDATWMYLQRNDILNLHSACKLNAWLKLWSDAHPTTLPSLLIYLCSRCRPTLQWWALPIANLLFTLLSAQENKKRQVYGLFWKGRGSGMVSRSGGKAYLCWAHTWPANMRLNRLWGKAGSQWAAKPQKPTTC